MLWTGQSQIGPHVLMVNKEVKKIEITFLCISNLLCTPINTGCSRGHSDWLGREQHRVLHQQLDQPQCQVRKFSN